MIAQAISGDRFRKQPTCNDRRINICLALKEVYQGKNEPLIPKKIKGTASCTTIKSAFRQYPSYKESLEEYARLFEKGNSQEIQVSIKLPGKRHAATIKESTNA